MKQFAIIGMSYFARSVLDELLQMDVEVILIDRDKEIIDEFADAPVNAMVLDVLSEDILRKALPETIDGVVIDLGDSIEASILATSYCKKMNIPIILVKAETTAHAEILELVGATRIVFPSKEAAKKVVPSLFSDRYLNYLPVSGRLVIAELSIPSDYWGKTVLECELRKRLNINLIFIKGKEDEEYSAFLPDYRFKEGDIALVSGDDDALGRFVGKEVERPKKVDTMTTLKRLFALRK